MTLFSLALKNVRHHARGYFAYFLSCSFAVWVFFLYAALLFHPVLKEKTIPGQFVALLYLVEIVVAIFSALFIGYSLSAFLRNRKRDIGLLQVMGMSVNQLTRLLAWENLMVGCLAMIVGIGMGLVFFKLFLLGVSAILELEKPIPYVFSGGAILLTCGYFLLLFSLLSWWNRFTIRRVSIADLFREAVQEKKKPVFSIWLVLLSILCIGGSYYLALTASASNLVIRMLPILALCLIGTYFGFTQLSVAVISRCEKLPSFYFRGKNMLLLSELRFRLKDNARILFMVAILSSSVLTAVSVSATYYLKAERTAQEQAPYHLSWQESEETFTSGDLKKWIRKNHLTVEDEVNLSLIQAGLSMKKGEWSQVRIISNSNFNQLLKNGTDLPPLRLQKGEAALSYSGGVWKESSTSIPGKNITCKLGKQTFTVQIVKEVKGVLFNELDATRFMLVVDDTAFKKMDRVAPKENHVTVHGYRFSDWKKAGQLLQEMKQKKIDVGKVNGTYIVYVVLKGFFAPLMFVSLFIGLLFFLASGSILYFRMFTELPYDRRQMMVLGKLGIREKDAVSILAWQIRLLFLLPIAVGTVHSAVAMKMFSFLFKSPVWGPFGAVAVVFLTVYGLYYVWTSRGYTQTVIKQSCSLK